MQLDAVLAANDGTAGGAIQALTEEGITGKVIVTGQDAEKASVQYIIDGKQSMTVFKDVRTLVKDAIAAGLDMSREDGFRYEASLFGVLFATEDQKEGMRAFIDKRKPLFKNR